MALRTCGTSIRKPLWYCIRFMVRWYSRGPFLKGFLHPGFDRSPDHTSIPNFMIVADIFYPSMMVISCIDAAHNVSAALPESYASQRHRMDNNLECSHEDAIKPYDC